MNKIIVVAGATGNLGGKIIDSLIRNNAEVRAVVRVNSDENKVLALEQKGVRVHRVQMDDVVEVSKCCAGAACVVSALAGLDETIIGAQKILLDAAVKAAVPRFIPSDYSIDFTNL